MIEKVIICPAGENGRDFLQSTGGYFYCGGKGTCGKCKVRVLEGEAGKLSKAEEEMLTEREKAENVRLLCQIKAVTDLKLYMQAEEMDITENRFSGRKEVWHDTGNEDTEERKRFGAAFDIGTTTVAGKLFDLDEKRPIQEIMAWNPQGGFGADVISRMQYCLEQPNGMKHMQKKITGCMNEMLRYFEEKVKTGICVVTAAGNSAMTHFLLGRRVDTLAKVPFQPLFTEGQEIDGKDCGLCVKDDVKLYTLPLLRGQVGGDITAALLSIDIFSRESGTLLADIGTNGEIAFFWNGKIYICSTAAGPALEGAGISCGMRAQTGAIEKVWLMGGEIYTKVIGNVTARGICGSALIDVIAVLLDLGKVHSDGYLENGSFVLYRRENQNSNTEEENICVKITQEDIRQYQMVKGAVRAGIETVVHAAGATEKDISQVYIAGSFGSNIRKQNAIKTGLLPDIALGKVTTVGNASLKGASMVLLFEETKQYAERIKDSTVLVNLAEKREFQEMYIKQMNFLS